MSAARQSNAESLEKWRKRAMPWIEEAPRHQGRAIAVFYDKMRRAAGAEKVQIDLD